MRGAERCVLRQPLYPWLKSRCSLPCLSSVFYSSYGVATRFVIGLWSHMSTLLQKELSEPLAAIVSNAQAGQRMLPADVDSELMEVLADIAEDGKRAGELLKRFEKLVGDG